MTTATRVYGRDIRPGDAITFCPGKKPIRFVRIDAEQWTQTALNMTYRIAYDIYDAGYALFDDEPLHLADRSEVSR